MEHSFKNEVKLFMVFDILGDTERTGPHLWHIERKRLEDVKNHILDLILIARILKKHFPTYIDFNKINDYIICHDIPEAITGDITKFEGVSEEEIKRVTNLAIKYLAEKFNDILDLETIINNFENKVDIESKIVYMIDKVHSASTFIKYQSEKNVDMNDPRIIPELRNLPFVAERIDEGKDLADIFFEFHIRSVTISDEECKLYNISREDADKIVDIIREFATEIYNQKLNKTLLEVKNDFPKDAMLYNRNKEE
ncbi:MAG: HD domain-containing protein [Ruminococcus sp.]|nr:HD domain-containing protein [Ruminococcus sp.]